MIIKVATKVGGVQYQFEIDEKDEMDALHKAAVLGNPPLKCDACEQDEIFRLDSNKDKEGNTYVNVVCGNIDCRAKAKLGRYKVGGYFWHKFERWISEENQNKVRPKEDFNDKDEEAVNSLLED